MENENLNLGSQEPTNSGKPANTKTVGMIAIAVIAILAIILLIVFFPRGAKSTVKQFVGAMEKGDGDKIVKLIDFDGMAAFSMSSKDLSKFDDSYKEYQDMVKKLGKDEKKAYDEMVKKTKDSLKSEFKSLKDAGVKYTVKNVKAEKVDGSKKLTKVTCDIVMKKDGNEHTQEGVVFYTISKGTKSYIVGGDMM